MFALLTNINAFYGIIKPEALKELLGNNEVTENGIKWQKTLK